MPTQSLSSTSQCDSLQLSTLVAIEVGDGVGASISAVATEFDSNVIVVSMDVLDATMVTLSVGGPDGAAMAMVDDAVDSLAVTSEVTGVVGPRGPDGATGTTGQTGPVGPMGSSGVAGPIGPAGPRGFAGEKGEAGPIGPMGTKGDVGPVGPIGQSGAPGADGQAGPIGSIGPKGDMGAQGVAGPAGLAGLKGDTGATGPTGPTGPSGVQGERGVKGDAGPDGARGFTGSQGVPGPIGPQGAVGPMGDTGPIGASGPAGADADTVLAAQMASDIVLGTVFEFGDKQATLATVAENALVPTLSFVGSFLTPPTGIDLGGLWKQNAVYKNPAAGHSYVLTGDPLRWEVYLSDGEVGADGEIGPVGNSYVTFIESSNGTVFRVGGGSATLLAARVFLNGIEVTDATSPGWFKWRRVSGVPREPPYDDATWNALYSAGYKTIALNVDDINARATFFCDIISS